MSGITTLTGKLLDASGKSFDVTVTTAPSAVVPPPPKETPDNTVILLGSAATLTFASGNVVALTKTGQIEFTPLGKAAAVDPITKDVVAICKLPGQIVGQRVSSGAYYATADGISGAWAQIAASSAGPLAPPVVVVPSGAFKVAGGRIIGPDGKDWVAKGINVMDKSMAVATKAKLLALFPGITCVRLMVGFGGAGFDNAQSPESIIAYVNSLTAAPNPIVVFAEDHVQQGGTNARTSLHPLFTTLGNAFKGNTYAWLGSMNEPVGEVTAEHEIVVNGVRATGNTNMIVLCTRGGNPIASGGSPFGSKSAATYASMTNVCWDMHGYNWEYNGSTDQNFVNTTLAKNITDLQAIATSRDGEMPVIGGEVGYLQYVGSDGSVDAHGALGTNQVVTAALTTGKTVGSGATIFLWNSEPVGYGAGTDLVDRATNSALTDHGQHAAALIAA